MFEKIAYALKNLCERSTAEIILDLKQYFLHNEGIIRIKSEDQLPTPLYRLVSSYFLDTKPYIYDNPPSKIPGRPRDVFNHFERYRTKKDDHIRQWTTLTFLKKQEGVSSMADAKTLVAISDKQQIHWYSILPQSLKFAEKASKADAVVCGVGTDTVFLFTREGYAYTIKLNNFSSPVSKINLVCTTPSSSYYGKTAYSLYTKKTQIPSYSSNEELQAAYQEWHVEFLAENSALNWVKCREYMQYSSTNRWAIDDAVFEAIRLLPILSNYATSPCSTIRQYLEAVAQVRTIWECKSRYDIKRESEVDTDWIKQSTAERQWRAPSFKSVKNSKAWHSGKTVSKVATYYVKANASLWMYARKSCTLEEAWEHGLRTRNLNRQYRGRLDYQSSIPVDNANYGGLIPMRHKQKAKKLHSRDIDLLIEEALY